MKYVDPMFLLGAIVMIVFSILAGNIIEGVIFTGVFMLIGTMLTIVDMLDEIQISDDHEKTKIE